MSGMSGESRHCPADVIEFTWNVVIELKTVTTQQIEYIN